METIRFLLRHLGAFRRTFWLLLAVGGLDGAALFSVPILLAEFTKGDLSTVLLREVLPLLAGCFVASLGLQWCLRSWGESLTGWLANDLRVSLFQEAEHLRVEALARHHSGYLAALINRVTSAMGTLATTIVWLVGHMVTTLGLFFFFTARESLVLALINLAILIIFLVVSVLLSQRIVPLAEDQNRTAATMQERYIDFLGNLSTVKKLGIVEWATLRLRRVSQLNDRAVWRFQRFHANRWCLLHAIFFSSILTTIGFLLYQIEHGTASAPILILFVAGFSSIQSYAERFSELVRAMLEANAYVGQLTEVLRDEQQFGPRAIEPLSHIQCINVRYRHPDSSREFHIPEFSLTKSDRILITGRSGEGKSTFLGILANQRQPLAGECRWNGVPYPDYTESLTHSFAVVSQEAELFNLSLRENLCLDQTASDEEITALLRELALEDLLQSLPEGLATKVGEKGLRLSTGQKQRINIARALLLKRPVLLLDEPTSNLDSVTESAVIRCLSKVSPETALVIISHQPAIQEICTRRYRFEAGTLTQSVY